MPDLSRRYRMQLFFPELEEGASWKTFDSFASPMEALRACSDCLKSVRAHLGIPYDKEPDGVYVRFRIEDAEAGSFLAWDDEAGVLRIDTKAFDPPECSVGKA